MSEINQDVIDKAIDAMLEEDREILKRLRRRSAELEKELVEMQERIRKAKGEEPPHVRAGSLEI